MFSQIVPVFLFRMRQLWHAYPSSVVLLSVSSFLLLIAVGAQYAVRLSLSEANEKSEELRASAPRVVQRSATGTGDAAQSLPPFNGTVLASVFNQAAAELKLPVEEIAYSLDNNPNQPFLRYRATLALHGGYPVVRRFIDRVHKIGSVELDSIACARENIAAASLRCDLSFSAFYLAGGRG